MDFGASSTSTAIGRPSGLIPTRSGRWRDSWRPLWSVQKISSDQESHASSSGLPRNSRPRRVSHAAIHATPQWCAHQVGAGSPGARTRTPATATPTGVGTNRQPSPCRNGTLDRYPADLQAIPWHLLIADEALRYANPATEAHQALAQVRFGSVADCWLLTATPRGKSAEHLDVLVGLAVGDGR